MNASGKTPHHAFLDTVLTNNEIEDMYINLQRKQGAGRAEHRRCCGGDSRICIEKGNILIGGDGLCMIDEVSAGHNTHESFVK